MTTYPAFRDEGTAERAPDFLLPLFHLTEERAFSACAVAVMIIAAAIANKDIFIVYSFSKLGG
jgi:hypothetical protein